MRNAPAPIRFEAARAGLRRAALVALAIAPLAARTALADAFDPLAYASGGPFPDGSVAIDTTALTVGGVAWPGAQLVPTGSSDAAVFAFDGGAVATGDVTVVGAHPAVILYRGPAALSGNWTVYAGRGTGSGTGQGDPEGGSGGGGFGGTGGDGANALGGVSYGDLFGELVAGSNGGARYGNDAALSGGAVEIGAIGSLDVSGARISSDGAAGATVDGDGLGGASGGGIFLHAYDVTFDAQTRLSARGGRGGDHAAGPFEIGYGGGGGGGGRVAVLWNELGVFAQDGAAIDVAGGNPGLSETVAAEAGGQGVFASQSSPTIGLPEPGSAVRGVAAILAIAISRRR